MGGRSKWAQLAGNPPPSLSLVCQPSFCWNGAADMEATKPNDGCCPSTSGPSPLTTEPAGPFVIEVLEVGCWFETTEMAQTWGEALRMASDLKIGKPNPRGVVKLGTPRINAKLNVQS